MKKYNIFYAFLALITLASTRLLAPPLKFKNCTNINLEAKVGDCKYWKIVVPNRTITLPYESKPNYIYWKIASLQKTIDDKNITSNIFVINNENIASDKNIACDKSTVLSTFYKYSKPFSLEVISIEGQDKDIKSTYNIKWGSWGRFNRNNLMAKPNCQAKEKEKELKKLEKNQK